MYLDGQLPYGPVSSNTGGQVTTDAMASIFGNHGNVEPLPLTTDPTGGVANTESTYLLPGGSDTVVSPSVATADGIVQYPLDQMKSPTGSLDTDSASYSQCGDYAADGSLSTIRNRPARSSGCSVSSGLPTGLGLGLLALVGLVLLTPKKGKR